VLRSAEASAAGKQRVVLVTGCSAGIGRATATLLAARGWRVFATTRHPDKDPGLCRRLSATGRVEIIGLDLTDRASIDAAAQQVLTASGGELYGVIHNAGIGDAGFFEDMSDQGFRHVLETNFFGAVALTRATLPVMRQARAGRFVVVSSAAVFFPNPWQTAYTASKTALEGWAESLASEVRPFGIKVAVVEPGMHRTGMWGSALISRPADSPYRFWLDSLEPRMRELAMRRGGDPRKVASVIAVALETGRPRFRYPVGLDAWSARFVRLLPEPARGAIRQALFGKATFQR
jgi:NAD(P)-dependent dehydrogenase (short-subunit alcohol dehydrogenase family)